MRIIINNNDSINGVLSNAKSGDEIFIKNGVYKEKVKVFVDGISIIGESKDGVIITNNDYYHKIMEDGNECNTFRTYSLYVFANDVKISNLTIENSATPSSVYGQAVALHVDGDNFIADNLVIKSAQDTLFTGPMPDNLLERYKGFHEEYQLLGRKSKQIYNHCTIVGDVDFIFGGAMVLFNKCEIYSLPRKGDNTLGFIAAPSHKEDDEFGYLFLNCNLVASKNTLNVYYARPWRDYGTAAFIECSDTGHIRPEGFSNWSGTNRDKTARFYEYNSKIDRSRRVRWSNQLSKDEAIEYVNNFLNYNNFFKNNASE